LHLIIDSWVVRILDLNIPHFLALLVKGVLVRELKQMVKRTPTRPACSYSRRVSTKLMQLLKLLCIQQEKRFVRNYRAHNRNFLILH
jgi:Na+/glutamate symporter